MPFFCPGACCAKFLGLPLTGVGPGQHILRESLVRERKGVKQVRFSGPKAESCRSFHWNVKVPDTFSHLSHLGPVAYRPRDACSQGRVLAARPLEGRVSLRVVADIRNSDRRASFTAAELRNAQATFGSKTATFAPSLIRRR